MHFRASILSLFVRPGKSIVLSRAGEIVRCEWIALVERFARLVLDEFVIMPNHLHGVLAFVGQVGGASRGTTGGASPSPTTTNTTTKPGGASLDPKGGASLDPKGGASLDPKGGASLDPKGGASRGPTGGASPSPTLFDVIGAFKSISTIKVNKLLGRRGVPLWQRSYYEHIVRTGEDLMKIQRYISENPLMWSLDPENPNCKSS